MKRKAKLLSTISLVGMDALMMGLAFFLAYRLRLLTEYENIAPFPSYWGMMLIQLVSLLTLFFFYKLYHRQRVLSYIDEFYSVFGATSVGTIVAFAFISFIFKNRLDYPRLMMVYAWILTVLLVSVGRLVHNRLWRALQARGWGRDRVLIVGTGEVARMILQKIRYSPGLGYEAVGLVAQTREEPLKPPILGTVEELPSIIESKGIDEVIIGLPEASHQEILTIISLCEREKVNIKVFPDVFQIMARKISIGDLDGMPLLTVGEIPLHGWRAALKRAMDLVGAAIGLILFSPLMLLTALLIKLDSPGPVFYTQERMGLDAKPFMILKFRSMRKDAEAETGPVWATEEDPRCTRLGAFIRRFSIDELPQLINVLLGEMSLVGPRPERPPFVKQFEQSIPRYMERHRVKAGMTGWAQIHGLRGYTSIYERTKYDLWYIENWSLLLDIKIILKTILNLLTGRKV